MDSLASQIFEDSPGSMSMHPGLLGYTTPKTGQLWRDFREELCLEV